MLAVGNNELENNGSVGRDILCDKCGEYHEITYGEKVLDDGTKEPSNMLAFYRCGDKTYLAGIDGKLLKGDV